MPMKKVVSVVSQKVLCGDERRKKRKRKRMKWWRKKPQQFSSRPSRYKAGPPYQFSAMGSVCSFVRAVASSSHAREVTKKKMPMNIRQVGMRLVSSLCSDG